MKFIAVRGSKKPPVYHECQVEREYLQTTGITVNMVTGEVNRDKAVQTWVVGRCAVPLFSDPERSTGICRSCSEGWTHENNRATEKGLAQIASGKAS